MFTRVQTETHMFNFTDESFVGGALMLDRRHGARQ